MADRTTRSDHRGREEAATPVYGLAEDYVGRFAALDPVAATMAGIPGHEAEMTDYSPEGVARRAEHDRAVLAELATLQPVGSEERLAADVMAERLAAALEQYDAGERFRDLNILFSPVQLIRRCFDLMATDTVDHWDAIAERMSAVPAALAGAVATLGEGLDRGVVAARRQALACAHQASLWGGGHHGVPPFFSTLLRLYDQPGIAGRPSQRRDLENTAAAATLAYSDVARFLVEVYAPSARDHDPVGAETYGQWARTFNGMDIDLVETYLWGWEELHRIEEEMVRVAGLILPGRPIAAVIEMLDSEPEHSIHGVDAFRGWLQDLMDRTVEDLNGDHFHIPPPVRRIEAMMAPDGGAAAMYYTPPSEDFSRPGRTWYPALGRTRFPLWGEVSIAYHEGVPGHHLQLAQVRHLAGRLSRFQRTLAFVSGHAEGWALYAERLMGELGYLDRPEYALGMLRSQALRAARVVVDIGMHLELRIPRSESFAPGATWDARLALDFVRRYSYFDEEFVRSEIDRYLGMPGQAISYKVGERVWLGAREEARRRLGPAFDLKSFHAAALDLGPMGLGQLSREVGLWAASGGRAPTSSGTGPLGARDAQQVTGPEFDVGRPAG